MTEQTQYSGKKYTVFVFLGGMLIMGFLWFVLGLAASSRNYNQGMMDSSYNPSYNGGISSPSYDSISGKTPTNTGVVGNMTQNRKVTTNYLSVHVKAVKQFHNEVTAFVESVKGKVMNEYVTVSSDDQAESGTMTVLVPNKDAQAFFDMVGQKVIKVVDRQVNSYEITQEYTDIERNLAQYEATYAKILKFYDKATTVTELLQIQSQLDTVQRQIDSLKGRKMALDELSNNTQYTLYSSTNEFNLPYVPQGTFEFAKTFKLAVRSLIQTADKLMVGGIYVLVYVPLFAIIGLVVWGIKRVIQKKMS